jgi:hypothetical protein
MRSPSSSSGQLKNVELLKRAIKDHQIEGFPLDVAQMNWEYSSLPTISNVGNCRIAHAETLKL